MGIEVMEKWEWECSVGLGMDGNGNGDDSMGVGREWEQESHSRKPLDSIPCCAAPYNGLAVGWSTAATTSSILYVLQRTEINQT